MKILVHVLAKSRAFATLRPRVWRGAIRKATIGTPLSRSRSDFITVAGWQPASSNGRPWGAPRSAPHLREDSIHRVPAAIPPPTAASSKTALSTQPTGFLMLKHRLHLVLAGLCLVASQAVAQQATVTGKVTDEQGGPLRGVSVVVKGTTTGTVTGDGGNYSIRAAPTDVLQFKFIGTTPVERTVGSQSTINVQLKRVAASLDAIVVTSLGQTASARELGTAQQTVSGLDIAQTQRPNFINALQGRIAGVDVTSTSGAPGASSSITIRVVSSISSTNQPLMIVDGLPIDNKTTNTGNLSSDAPTSSLALSNRNVDFTNRAADINPEDIESITVLKGPEASALYGIDAANGAIVITTKRGRNGGGFDYSNNFSVAQVRAKPEMQDVFGPNGTLSISGSGYGSYIYFGAPYSAGTWHHDNIC